MTTKPKVAIIGLGNIGQVVAINLAKSNRTIIVSDSNASKVNELNQKLGNKVIPMDIAEAITAADMIVFAVWFNTAKELLITYSQELQGKIIVDPTNPIAPDDNGGFKKNIGEKESAGEILSSMLPKGTKFVKALGSLGVASLSKAAFQQPEKAVLFYAANDRSIDHQIEELIADNGFGAVRVGDLSQSIRLEVFGDLHEFGALGKTVSIEEAKSKI